MQVINVFNAKTHFSKLIEQIVTGEQNEFVISRHGLPVARLVPIEKPKGIVLGLAQGEFEMGDDDVDVNADIAASFLDNHISRS
jgi:prevent-host-death family protein